MAGYWESVEISVLQMILSGFVMCILPTVPRDLDAPMAGAVLPYRVEIDQCLLHYGITAVSISTTKT